MKKVFSIILSTLCIVICLCGCGKGKELEYKEKLQYKDLDRIVIVEGKCFDNLFTTSTFKLQINNVDAMPELPKMDIYNVHYLEDFDIENLPLLVYENDALLVNQNNYLHFYNEYLEQNLAGRSPLSIIQQEIRNYIKSKYTVSYIQNNKIIKKSPEKVVDCNCIRYRVEDVETLKQVDICVCEELGIIMKIYDANFTYFEITSIEILEG